MGAGWARSGTWIMWRSPTAPQVCEGGWAPGGRGGRGPLGNRLLGISAAVSVLRYQCCETLLMHCVCVGAHCCQQSGLELNPQESTSPGSAARLQSLINLLPGAHAKFLYKGWFGDKEGWSHTLVPVGATRVGVATQEQSH